MWMPARQHWQRAFYIPAERSARQEEMCIRDSKMMGIIGMGNNPMVLWM